MKQENVFVSPKDMVRITEELYNLTRNYSESQKVKLQWATRKLLTYLNSQYIYNMEYFVTNNKTFQTKFNSMMTQIMNTMERCDAETSPAEKVLTDIEIIVALNQNQKLINRCANPSVELQMYICKKDPANFKYIKHPAPEVVNFVILEKKHYDAIKYTDTALLPTNVKIAAFTEGNLPDNKFNKTEILNYLENNPDAITVCTTQFVQALESRHKLFTPAELEQFRLALIRIQSKISHNGLEMVSNRPGLGRQIYTKQGIYNPIEPKTPQEFFIKYMNNPGSNICSESVYLMPYSIKEIGSQSEALQEIALRQGFEKSFDLNRVYSYLRNPSDRIQMLYSIMCQIRQLATMKNLPKTLYNDLLNEAHKYGIPTTIVKKSLHVLGTSIEQKLRKKMNQRVYGV